MKNYIALAVIALTITAAQAQHPTHASEVRKPTRGDGPEGKSNPTFLVHRLGSDHAEGITTLDMNGDGFLDILSGAYWYENPGAQGGEWKRHQFRTVGIHGEFVSDCGEWTIDVNHDGLPDLVTTGWISNGIWWYENPGRSAPPGTLWQEHFITDSYDTEGGAIGDIDGDGHLDLVFAHYNHSGVLWISFAKPSLKSITSAAKIRTATASASPTSTVTARPTSSLPMVGSRTSMLPRTSGSGNPAGISATLASPFSPMTSITTARWTSSTAKDTATASTGSNKAVHPPVDESFSQSHALQLADLGGDGSTYLITGKRYRGHNGDDPGSYDPNVIYAYKINGDPKFTRIPLSYNGTSGVGTQIIAEDLDKDGDIDIAVAGKLGVHFLENLKINKVSKQMRESQQPLERTWPFPNEGLEVPQEDGPK